MPHTPGLLFSYPKSFVVCLHVNTERKTTERKGAGVTRCSRYLAKYSAEDGEWHRHTEHADTEGLAEVGTCPENGSQSVVFWRGFTNPLGRHKNDRPIKRRACSLPGTSHTSRYTILGSCLSTQQLASLAVAVDTTTGGGGGGNHHVPRGTV